MAQDVSAAFTVEETDSVRTVAHNLLVSWKKEFDSTIRIFTIGVSTIGGADIIGANPGAVGSPGNYRYFDESANVTQLGWERALNIPLGGLVKGAADITLDNTSKRYTPDFMGGESELFTAMLPRRPFIINGGFKVSGIDETIPQFSGITSGRPKVYDSQAEVVLQGFDYIDFFHNKYMDQTVMFTSQTTDQLLTRLFQDQAGMNTAQYEFDTGLNTIPFGYFEKGEKLADVAHEIVAAENGHLFQDESGVVRFWNRQHWSLPPYTSVQRVLATSQVINAEMPNQSNLINVVEVKSKRYQKQPNQQIFKLAGTLEILANSEAEIFVNFDNPVLELDTPEFYVANTEQDETGTDITGSVAVKSVDTFTNAAKIVFINNNASDGYITQLSLYGRVAKPTTDIYVRSKDDSSLTAYEEQPLVIENKYIQDSSWAASLAQIILNQYSDPDRLQILTIRAIPELQIGDLISWRGRDWRIYGVTGRISAGEGFVQDLLISQSASSTITYFTIGVSTIGSTDIIAP